MVDTGIYKYIQKLNHPYCEKQGISSNKRD